MNDEDQAGEIGQTGWNIWSTIRILLFTLRAVENLGGYSALADHISVSESYKNLNVNNGRRGPE